MRRAFLSSLALLTVSLGVLAGAGAYYIDTIIKNGIERVGPRLTGVEVKVGSVRASILKGELKLYRFRIRNPKGFRIQNAFMADFIRIRIRWLSLLTDTIEIEEIYVKKPTVVYEGLFLRNNLKSIRRNIESYTGKKKGSRKSGGRSRGGGSDSDGPSWRIGRFRVRDGEIVVGTRLLGKKKGITLNMPENDERDIGGGGDTSLKDAAAEMARSVARTAGEQVRKSSLKEDILRAAKEFRKSPKEKAKKALEDVQGLLDTKRD